MKSPVELKPDVRALVVPDTKPRPSQPTDRQPPEVPASSTQSEACGIGNDPLLGAAV